MVIATETCTECGMDLDADVVSALGLLYGSPFGIQISSLETALSRAARVGGTDEEQAAAAIEDWLECRPVALVLALRHRTGPCVDRQDERARAFWSNEAVSR